MFNHLEQTSKILYGGDYNPEQWPEAVWKQDMRLFRLAGIDTVTLNVFSWATLQPNEETWNFTKLDKIIKLASDNNLNIILATSTGAMPAWMAHRHPDVLRTEFGGTRRKFGGRHNACPSSPTYRKYAAQLARKLAQRYGSNPHIIAWHIGNEFGGECYCENCEASFREWLKNKYGTLEALNAAWNTSFWGHTFYSWDEIVAPDTRSEHIDVDQTMFQGISLDYRRFMSDRILECYCLERDAVKAETPDIPVTTNLMGFYKPLDYKKWAREMDFVSWDNYPSNQDSFARIAMSHDLMRGIGGGKPFALMEQTPSVTNWLSYNALKRPGVMRLWSWQAVAHGADTVLFFQLRRSSGACEKLHGAVIDHAGSENTRVFREIETLGNELVKFGAPTLGAETPAQTALIFDWDNWWAVTYSAGPSADLDYLKEFSRFYEILREMNVDVDIVGPEDDLSPYKLVIAPVYYMVKGNEDENLRKFVANGGTAVTTFFSGLAQENDLITLGGYPGKLRDLFGIWVEESDALPHGDNNHFQYGGQVFPARILCDLIHLEKAEQVDESGYLEDFYQGMPVVTVNEYGKGKAYYLATSSSRQFYRGFLTDLCRESGISPVMTTPEGVEAACRIGENGKFVFLLNHSGHFRKTILPWSCCDLLTGTSYRKGDEIDLEAADVAVLKVGESEKV
ncbi:MAG: beta-galactosidase [Eubacteriaceae bacterium]